jgi:protein transport protein SEC31
VCYRRCSISDIAWNPEDGLYLVTACDDDSRPVLRVWDLRSSTTAPLCELAGGHTKGVLSVDWCPWDSNLLVSCGKDARTLVWDIQQGRPIAEVPSGGPEAAQSRGAPHSFATHSVPDGFHGATSVFGAPPSSGGLPGSDAASLFGGGGAGTGGGTMLGGLGAGASRRYLTRWSKRAPGLIASCSLDRCVSVHTVTAVGPQAAALSTSGGGLDATLRRAPRWLRRPVGASFSFGGKLVSFASPITAAKSELRSGAVQYSKRIQISSVTTGHDFVSRALELEGALTGVEAGTVDPRSLCDSKSDANGDRSTQASPWAFMRLLLEPDARQRVLSYVGYDGAAIAAELSKYSSGAPSADATGAVSAGNSSEAALDHRAEAVWSASGGGCNASPADTAPSAADLFGSSLGAQLNSLSRHADAVFGDTPPHSQPSVVMDGNSEKPPSFAQLASSEPGNVAVGPAIVPDIPGAQYERRKVPSSGDDAVLKHALLIGDFSAAVSVCFSQERFADALLLASCGTAEVWAAAKDEYFRRRASPLTPMLSAVTLGDYRSFVASAPLASWRDVLGLLCTYAKPDEFSGLCEALGDRLARQQGEQEAACTVYMAALSTAKAVGIWAMRARHLAKARQNAVPALLDLVEKSCLLRYIVYATTGVLPSQGAQPEAAGLLRFCNELANEGFLPTAAFFAARIVDTDDSVAGAMLRHRLSHSFSRGDYAYPAAQALANAPAPFTVANIGVAPVSRSLPMQQYGNTHLDAYGGASDSRSTLQAPLGYVAPHASQEVHAHHMRPPVATGTLGYSTQSSTVLHPSSAVSLSTSALAASAARVEQQYPVPTMPSSTYGGPQLSAQHNQAHPPSRGIPPAGVSSHGFNSGPLASVSAASTAAAPLPLPQVPSVAQQFPGSRLPSTPLQPAVALPAAPAPAPPPQPQPQPVSPEMQAALQALAGTVSALGSLQLTSLEQRQLQDASAALATIQVSVIVRAVCQCVYARVRMICSCGMHFFIFGTPLASSTSPN